MDSAATQLSGQPGGGRDSWQSNKRPYAQRRRRVRLMAGHALVNACLEHERKPPWRESRQVNIMSLHRYLYRGRPVALSTVGQEHGICILARSCHCLVFVWR